MMRLFWILSLLVWCPLIVPEPAAAERQGIVQNERVNLRTRPSISSEVIHQLNTGDKVVILGFERLTEVQTGEPREWFKIEIPEQVQLWIASQYIDPETKAVIASRLNVRAGKGQNYTVVGRIDKNVIVHPLRTSAGWTAIRPVPGTAAYIAAEFVNQVQPDANPEPEDTSPTKPEIAGKPQETNPLPPVIVDDNQQPSPQNSEPVVLPEKIIPNPEASAENPTSNNRPPPIENSNPISPIEPSPGIKIEPPELLNSSFLPSRTVPELPENETRRLRRVITRDGIVRRTRSIQAPTYHRLMDHRTGTIINYLYVEDFKLELGKESRDVLKDYEGSKIRVQGVESIDSRWPHIPVIEVERLRVLQ